MFLIPPNFLTLVSQITSTYVQSNGICIDIKFPNDSLVYYPGQQLIKSGIVLAWDTLEFRYHSLSLNFSMRKSSIILRHRGLQKYLWSSGIAIFRQFVSRLVFINDNVEATLSTTSKSDSGKVRKIMKQGNETDQYEKKYYFLTGWSLYLDVRKTFSFKCLFFINILFI